MFYNAGNKLVCNSKFEDAKEISIYDAIELVIHCKFTWIGEINIDVDKLLEKYSPKDVEEYGWCVVVSEDYYKTHNEEDWIQLLKSFKKNYVLLRCYGDVELYPIPKNNANISIEGPKPHREKITVGGGDFSIGLYAYANDSISECERGTFRGHYFKCVYDPAGLKDGALVNNFQELFFPYNIEKIMWEGVHE